MSDESTREVTTSVTVVGLGMMGAALAGAYLQNGSEVTVWNRSAHKADDLAARGAIRANTVAEAIEANTVVIVCLSTYETVYAALEQNADKLAGKVLVNLTSGTPDEAREFATWAADRGIDYLDGAVMAVPPMIGLPHALIFYGGFQELYEKHEPALKVMAGGSTYLGTDTGIPMIYDLALLGILWSTLAGYLNALALVGTVNVAAEDFLSYATSWVNHVALPSMPNKAQEVDAGEYTTEISTLDVNKAAIAHLVEASESQGINPSVMLPIQQLIEQRVAEGHGSDSLGSLFEAIRHPKR